MGAKVAAGSKVAVATGAATGAEVAEAPQATANNTTITASPAMGVAPFLVSIRNDLISASF